MKLIKEDLRRREVQISARTLTAGRYWNTCCTRGATGDRIDEETEGGIKTYCQAAARYIRTHRPDLDWLEADLQPTEKQSVQDFINTLDRCNLRNLGRMGLGGETRKRS